jgi:hypothetical protein
VAGTTTAVWRQAADSAQLATNEWPASVRVESDRRSTGERKDAPIPTERRVGEWPYRRPIVEILPGGEDEGSGTSESGGWHRFPLLCLVFGANEQWS